MKKLAALVKNVSGFSIIEVLLSMVIIAVCAGVVIMWQKSSWSQTITTNRLMVAGQVVDKQIEKQRMIIAENPVTNFATFKTGFDNRDSVMIDSSISPPMSVRWHAYDTLHDPHGNSITDVYQIKLVAWWKGASPNDSLKLETRIAQNF
jgi:prepilin-type N-terminal cleavage/methylation domain-containing protein